MEDHLHAGFTAGTSVLISTEYLGMPWINFAVGDLSTTSVCTLILYSATPLTAQSSNVLDVILNMYKGLHHN